MANTNSGRKRGSKNRITSNAKEELLELLENNSLQINSLFNTGDHQTRVSNLKFIAKLLTTGNDAISIKTKELLYNSLEEHFKKIRFYIPALPQEKKVSELRQFLKLLPPKRIEEVLKDMNRRQNIKF